MTNAQPVETDALSKWLTTHTAHYTMAGVAAGALFPLVASFIKVAELGVPPTPGNLLAAQGEPLLWIIDTAPLFLGFLAGIAGRRHDLVARSNRLLLEREAELTASRTNLEAGISERTHELDQRNAEMRSVIAIARQIAEVRDLTALLPTAVQLISERFAGYAASLYLLDETAHFAVLRASSSEAGRTLMREGFRITVGDQSVVGRVARRGKLLISEPRTDGHEQVGRGSASLPPASVLALPLVVRGRVTGVLEVEAQRAAPTTQYDAEVLQLLADQLAAAIENARLVTASRTTVEQLQSLTGEGTRRAWQEYLKNHALTYQLTPVGANLAGSGPEGQASQHLSIPVLLRGQEIGSISLQRRAGTQWTRSEQDLLEKLAAQLALALENARLIEETRQRALQEQTVSAVSGRFSRSLDVDALLQVAVREFAALPEVAEATVVLKPTTDVSTQIRNAAS
ncbi:MAG TPA: GAF domain-containing protein [Anaerolineales bacterium]